MGTFALDLWVDRVEQLVGLNSVSAPGQHCDSSNLAVVERLAQWLDDLKFDCQVVKLADQCDSHGRPRPERYNLYARRGPNRSGGLVWSGHTDTVPANEQDWQADPWKLRRLDDRVIGLGTADMKGFFASLVGALEQINLSDLTRPLLVIATADEESVMSGARELDGERLAGFHRAIIGEPTGLTPVYAHKGVLMERIRLRGRAGHSSRPDLGRNAIYGMNKVINALHNWQEVQRASYTTRSDYRDFDLGWPSINFGHIQGGDIANRVSADCLLDIDCRFFADSSCAEQRATVRRLAMEAIDGLALDIGFEELFGGIEALSTERASGLIRCLEKNCQQAARGVSFATEGPFFQRWLSEVAICGPGKITHAHQAEEFVSLQATQQFDALTRRLIHDLCIGEVYGSNTD